MQTAFVLKVTSWFNKADSVMGKKQAFVNLKKEEKNQPPYQE